MELVWEDLGMRFFVSVSEMIIDVILLVCLVWFM